MAHSEDTEITLGTGKLLVLFFGLVAVCALFFGLGYSLGRRSDISALASSPSVQAASGVRPAVKSGQGTPAQPPMTFYKSVEQKDASPQLTPASEGGSSGSASTPAAASSADANAARAQTASTPSAPDPTTLPTANAYYVQVAAVSKDEDAESLADALKKKQYPAFVASNSTMDKLFRVQLGPFADIKEAEDMRARLVNDGYNPILKK